MMLDISFDNAVWRINFLTSRECSLTFHWHWVSEPYESEAGTVSFSVYSITLLDQSIRICQGIDPYPGVELADYPLTIADDKWHEIEISTYKDIIEVWLDGIQVLEYQDPDPLPGGQLGLELWPSQDEDSVFIPAIFSYTTNRHCERSAAISLSNITGSKQTELQSPKRKNCLQLNMRKIVGSSPNNPVREMVYRGVNHTIIIFCRRNDYR